LPFWPSGRPPRRKASALLGVGSFLMAEYKRGSSKERTVYVVAQQKSYLLSHGDHWGECGTAQIPKLGRE